MEYFFAALASVLFGLAKSVWFALVGLFAWLMRLFWPVWLVWLVAALVLALGGSCRTCEAGWFDWAWGDSKADIKKIERSAEIAQEAARVTSEAAKSQAQQAVAQAQQAAAQAHQNARVADLLGELSKERQNLAEKLSALNAIGLQDSQIAAVLGASGPVLVCVTALMVAGLALWLAARPGAGPGDDLANALDVMAEELAGVVSGSSGTGLRLGGPGVSSAFLRLPGPRGREHQDLRRHDFNAPDDSQDMPEDMPEDTPVPF